MLSTTVVCITVTVYFVTIELAGQQKMYHHKKYCSILRYRSERYRVASWDKFVLPYDINQQPKVCTLCYLEKPIILLCSCLSKDNCVSVHLCVYCICWCVPTYATSRSFPLLPSELKVFKVSDSRSARYGFWVTAGGSGAKDISSSFARK